MFPSSLAFLILKGQKPNKKTASVNSAEKVVFDWQPCRII